MNGGTTQKEREMKMQEHKPIIVVLEGGLVQSVITPIDAPSVVVVDYDTEGADPAELTVLDYLVEEREYSAVVSAAAIWPDDEEAADVRALVDKARKEGRLPDEPDACRTDGQAQANHEHGTRDCKSPYLWR